MQALQRRWPQLAGGILLFLALNAGAVVRYVDVNNPAPSPPYTNWSSAAVTIQDAVDAAVAGDEIVVTNGVYQAGGTLAPGTATTNRVRVDKPVVLRSVNGPQATVIEGRKATGGGNGPEAVRCVYLTGGSVLAGFTLTNGATYYESGGGLYCDSPSAVVSNCVIAGNAASYYGGGACSATLQNCVIAGNSSDYLGGGAYSGLLRNCVLTGNSADSGGGAYGSELNNCTLTGNSASNLGGGACQSALNNSIVYFNTAPASPTILNAS
jgi:hypothetical protein